ncbi:hypothetical protein [Acinetobacter pittii]|uniref:hypothetical protein n=1 Tax=Acinetobacter pittii TaxID=48296 RepID=UPI00396F5968
MRIKYSLIVIVFLNNFSFASKNIGELYDFNSTLMQSEIVKNNSEISTYDGNISFNIIDIFLPGNGGLDISIGRKYDLNSVASGLTSSYRLTSDWVPLGIGWKIIGSPRIWAVNDYWFDDNYFKIKYFESPLVTLCNKGSIRETTYIDLPDGTTERLYSTGNSNVAKTKNNWVVMCLAGEISAKSPVGELYKFGNIDLDTYVGYEVIHGKAFIGYPDDGDVPMMGYFPDKSFTFMVAKEVNDLNGNWLKYGYKYHGNKYPLIQSTNGPLEVYLDTAYNLSLNTSATGGALLLTKVESSDGRIVNLEYDSNSGKLLKIKEGDKEKIKFNYNKNLEASQLSQSPPNSYSYFSVLSVVEYPELSDKITYEYFDVKKYSLVTLRNEFVDYFEDNYKDGRLSKILFSNGDFISYDYEKFNYPRNPLYMNYSSDDLYAGYRGVRLKEKKLSTGESWSYSYYREKGKLSKTKINGPLGEEIHSFYSVPSLFNSGVDSTWLVGKPSEIVLPNGSKINYEWKENYLLTGSNEFITEEGYIVNRNKIINSAVLNKITKNQDGGTYTTEYKNYDEYGNPGQLIETGPNGENRTTTLSYYNDPLKWIIGKPKDEKIYNGQTLVGSITRNYDNNGNVLSENKDGVVNINTYDAQGNIATSVNANGATTTFSNYKRGIAQTEVQPEGVTITREVDNAGNVISETNGAGQKTSYTYDVLDRMTTITPPIGDKTTITYTPTSKTTTQGNLVEVVNYDGFGRPKDSTKGGIKTSYKYDAFDNKTFESYPGATTGTTFTYDVLNRVKTITNPDNTKQTYEYGKASTSITDERGKKTTYNYRSYGNPEEQHLMSITAPVADANVTLTRNGRDLITTVKQKGLTRTYGYNSKYQLTSVDNPETGTTLLGRDNVGNMTSVKVGTSGITSLTYDGRNRNTSVTYPSGTAKVTKTYTKTDKLNSVSNTATLRKYTYDANDNLLTDTLTLDSKTFTTTYAYNGKDQLTTITYPQSGSVIDYAPDALGRPTKVGSYITSISYWPSGQFKQLNYANGTVSNYGQNTRLWPSSFDTKKGTVAHLNNNYTYDGVGNLLTIADSTDSNFNRTATYDDINRLITAQGPWGAGTLTYDGMGNITKQNFGSQVLDYVYNTTTNKLSSTSGSKLGTYSYDVLGNITSDGVNTYSYDAVPSLICAKCNDSSKRLDYSYDGLNKRVSVTKAGVKRYEILATNGDQLIEFIPSQNNKLTEYFYLGGKRIAQRISP